MILKGIDLKKIIQASLIASTIILVGCATPLIAPDIIENVKKVESTPNDNVKPQKRIVEKDANAIQIKKEPEIIEKIVVQKVPTPAPVVTKVVEIEKAV